MEEEEEEEEEGTKPKKSKPKPKATQTKTKQTTATSKPTNSQHVRIHTADYHQFSEPEVQSLRRELLAWYDQVRQPAQLYLFGILHLLRTNVRCHGENLLLFLSKK